ncbi:transporter [Robertkochia aurantiaca]|uniref:transporter n=1 Tax=Robertkochia aurantiaca TaxID=2873700 RepID=UPI001CCC1699|nr:transporter [Robertkochia sp. 3YJGBD-33]
MNKKLIPLLITLLVATISHSQYTEVINSNRPGASYSAFSVGTGVFQLESGFSYEQREHSALRTESNRFGVDYVFRYGLFFEQLELIIDGSYAFEGVTDNSTLPPSEYNNNDFLYNTIGAKFLLFDPFKDPDRNKPNLYSWRANNTFQWKNLMPAVAVYAGANFYFGDNPFFPEQPQVTPKVMVATQQHLTPRWVLVSNIIYDRFTSDDPMFNYIITLTHALKNPRYTIFAEHQGFNSDTYADGIFRVGGARLMNKNLQIDASLGMNIKDTPSRLFGAIGMSFRLDHHTDPERKVDNTPDYDKKALRKNGAFNKFKNKN